MQFRIVRVAAVAVAFFHQRFLAAILAGGCVVSHIAAQDYPMPDFHMNMWLHSTETAVSFEAQQMLKKAPENPAALPEVKTDFVQSPARTKQNLAQFIAKTRAAGNADAAMQMEQLFSQPNFMADVAKALAPYGLKTNDAADAMTLWWVASWNAAHGRTDTPSPATFAAVKAQVKRAFAATPTFAKTTDAQKQEMAEAMLLQGLLMDAASEQAVKQGGDMVQQVADAAIKGAKVSYNMDLTAMTLTPQGFVPTGQKPDAQQPPPAAPPPPAKMAAGGKLPTHINSSPQKRLVTGGIAPPQGVPLESVGGTFEPGKYVGKTFYQNHDTGKRDNESEMTLYLFENGEYTVAGKDENFGKPYSVNPANGQLDLKYGQSISFYNSNLAPGEDIALYGRFGSTAAVFGRSDRGFSNYYVFLVRVGPTGRLSPTQAQEKEEADAAEAARYKFTTAWGKGADIATVAAVAFSSQLKTFYNGSFNSSQSYEVYVLFKDGSFHEDFPIPLQVWDVATAKRRDAKRWGRWRPAGNGSYLLTFSDRATKRFSGEPTRPARSGEILAGKYGNGSSSGNLMGGSYSLRYITFTGNRFEIDESGGYGSSTFSQSVPGAVAINSTTSNGETFTSASGENFVVGSSRKGKVQARTGSYQLSGYTLRMQFDDGRVTYQPFFFVGGDDTIWYNDETRSR